MSSSLSFIHTHIYSNFLKREVDVTILLPLDFNKSSVYPLLLFNDGQDFPALNLSETTARMQHEQEMRPMIIAGIHANHRRIDEYGTAIRADYAGRGAEAGATTDFVISELLPFLREQYQVRSSGNAYAGFSLGGLMALDIAWNHSEQFSIAGILSGSLWWRQKAISDGYEDFDRIMHAQIRETATPPKLKCWFQCGSNDENDDRDGDGVIDSVQDTLECIGEMERKGLAWNRDVFYTEVVGGQHNPATWGQVMPRFLQWVSQVLE
ncbi:esterase family protein [Dyadobacter sp. CY343]|uniref:alpha/beta hydrolase n=1 Tax=Dyadobacter sp. CY343 TaxID=2907299 RepID=UPI001EEB8E60|nr:alpha/beta hydrolase-fold protein [Dyadobacter sp. CY343]MCE7060143.1 esterase family protein [Dyadobacter sp. CY343]